MAATALKSRRFAIVAVPAMAMAAIAAVAIAVGPHAFGRLIPASPQAILAALPSARMMSFGALAGSAAGLLAGLIGIGGGIVVVPAIYYGLVVSGMPADQAAHVAVATSLAAILPTALVSSFAHWRAGHADIAFLRTWGPGIAIGVVAGQLAAPHLRGCVMTGVFSVLCLAFAARFAFPARFRRVTEHPPEGLFLNAAGIGIGLSSGLAGVGGGIMTNIVMSFCGISMHKSIGRAAAVGVAVSLPATVIAALGPGPHGAAQLGSIDLTVLACIAPTQAAAAWVGARLARCIAGDNLSRVLAGALVVTGAVMLRSSLSGG